MVVRPCTETNSLESKTQGSRHSLTHEGRGRDSSSETGASNHALLAANYLAFVKLAAIRIRVLKRDEIWMNRHRALGLCLSVIFSENRCTLFRIML